MKKRILFVNEASFLNTGFSNIGNEVLKRLHNSGKYEVAELGSYVTPNDPRIASIPWKFYAGQPNHNDKAGMEAYNKPSVQWGKQVNLGQFGAWILDNVLLEFQPDYVVDIRDAWMVTPIFDSPLRKNYKIISMPCIDSFPQREEWMKMYESADYLLGYSDFAINTLNKQSAKIQTSGGRKLLPSPTRPGVDMAVFKPMDKAATRAKWKIQPDLPIILTCMRNQARKLFCELIDSFSKYKKDNPDDPTAQKAVLLIHSSAYDAGQEYWLHLYRISTQKYMPYYFKDLYKHVLHSFVCDACGSRHIDYAIKLMDAKVNNNRFCIPCTVCGSLDARAPNTAFGYTREELAEVFNLADVYVQVSIAGADEMPASEAKACGVPILASSYAALEEKTTKIKEKNSDGTPYSMHLGGIPIKIAHYFTEAATMQTRAYFDRNDLAKKLEILSDKEELKRLSADAVISARENCDYDKIVKKWEYVIDNLAPKDRTTTWDKPIDSNQFKVSISIPECDNGQFIDWCYINILKKEIDLVGKQNWLNQLSAGQSREEIVKFFYNVSIQDKMADMMVSQWREAKTIASTIPVVDENKLDGLIL